MFIFLEFVHYLLRYPHPNDNEFLEYSYLNQLTGLEGSILLNGLCKIKVISDALV